MLSKKAREYLKDNNIVICQMRDIYKGVSTYYMCNVDCENIGNIFSQFNITDDQKVLGISLSDIIEMYDNDEVFSPNNLKKSMDLQNYIINSLKIDFNGTIIDTLDAQSGPLRKVKFGDIQLWESDFKAIYNRFLSYLHDHGFEIVNEPYIYSGKQILLVEIENGCVVVTMFIEMKNNDV